MSRKVFSMYGAKSPVVGATTKVCCSNRINQVPGTTPTPIPTPTNSYNIALLFRSSTYYQGINDIVDLIKFQFPNTKMNIINYIVDGTIEVTDAVLDNFVRDYPSGNRAIICELTSITNECASYVTRNNLNILTLSVSSTSLTTQKLQNTLTYAYYLNNQVVTSFYVIQDYGIKNITLLYDSTSTNIIFMTSWKTVLKTQYDILKITQPELTYQEIDISTANSNYSIPSNSVVYLLIDTVNITGKYNNEIISKVGTDTGNYIFCTNLNYDIGDVFGNIPAVVAILCPSIYSDTSNLVYNAVKNKKIFYYSIYAFYDILYTLNYCSDKNITINKTNYLNANPFKNIPPAWSGGFSLNSSINGFIYGSYDLVFTKNVMLNPTLLVNPPPDASDDTALYQEFNNNGSISRLPDSLSVFKTCSLFPYLPTTMIYLDQNYIKIYNKNQSTLSYVKFDSNTTVIDSLGNYINSSQTIDCKFIVNFDKTTYLIIYFQKIFDNLDGKYPQVNQTMDKIPLIKYINP